MTEKQLDILSKLKERIDNDKPITYKHLESEDSSLLYAIQRHIGNITKACELLGISKEDMIKKLGFTRNIDKRTLSEREIKNRLYYLKSIGKLTTNSMRKEFDDLRLEQSIKKIYGSVQKCLDYHNLKRDIVPASKDNIIKDIEYYSNEGVDLSYSSMIEINPKLVSNATKKFKCGWNKILSDLGFEFIPKRIPYSLHNIKERVYNILEKHGEVNYTILKVEDSSILYYAHLNYESLEDFYSNIGLNPRDCMDFDTQKMKGFKFESTFKEILDALGINHKYNKVFKDVRPDFQLSNNIWIDTKLSSWTQSVKSTVDKYDKYCEKLIIVYLRGNKRKLYEFDNYNVEFRKVDYYYPLLEEIGRSDLIEKCESILI